MVTLMNKEIVKEAGFILYFLSLFCLSLNSKTQSLLPKIPHTFLLTNEMT